MYYLENEHIRLGVNQDATAFELSYAGQTPLIAGDRGLFDMIVGCGRRHEWAIDPTLQRGVVTVEGARLQVQYAGIQHGGETHDIKIVLTFTLDKDAVSCEAALENHSALCIEEFWFPFVGPFTSLSGAPETDTLIRPEGFGRRIVNPLAHVASLHTGYMAPDQVRILDCGFYPGGWMTMPWYGIYAPGRALSLFSLDESFQTTAQILSRDTPTGRLSVGIARYPFLESGRWEAPRSVVRLHCGDWHDDSRFYRRWVDATWWSQAARPQWIDEMHGWQRIILKHQYGEILWRYDDLVECFEAGMKYGINTLLVFGWFAGGHDNGYPEYEPDEELGGADKLAAAIREIQARGGRVILYANGHLIDVDSEYYKTLGHKVALKTSQGSEYREHYKFSGDGTYLRNFGAKSFAAGCQSTDEWRQKLLEIGEKLISFGPDAIFYDQLGGHVPYLCFDKSHPHPGPAFAQGPGKDRNLAAIRRELIAPRAGMGFGTELLSDCLVRHVDVIHNCVYGMSPGPQAFPELFLYTFPEMLHSNREARDERDHVRRLNWAFVHGWRFDVEIWRCRGDLSDAPLYGAYVQELVRLRERWPKRLMTGRFVDEDEFDNPCAELKVKGFVSGNRLAVIGWNDTAQPQRLAPQMHAGWEFEAGATVAGSFEPGEEMAPQSVAVLIYTKAGNTK